MRLGPRVHQRINPRKTHYAERPYDLRERQSTLESQCVVYPTARPIICLIGVKERIQAMRIVRAMESIQVRGWLPATLFFIATTNTIGSVLLAQDDLDANGQAVEQRVITSDEFLALIEQNQEAERLHRTAAEQGDADAQLQLGLAYVRGTGVLQDVAEGIGWVRLAAEQGHADAQYLLGIAFGAGHGVSQDAVEAVRWHRLAAEQGHIPALRALGNAYSLGNGVLKDEVESARWYRLAAEQGDAPAQLILGTLYARRVLENYVLAHMWFNISSANDRDFGGGFLRDYVEAKMTRAEISRATELARACMASDYQACEP